MGSAVGPMLLSHTTTRGSMGHNRKNGCPDLDNRIYGWTGEYATKQGRISADVIKKAFNATEEKFFQFVKHQMPVRPQIASVGSCCLVGAISDGELHVANLGDPRVVLGQKVSDGGKP
ncbi:hypothetical protein R6Q57_015138 [Mikania cordata]